MTIPELVGLIREEFEKIITDGLDKKDVMMQFDLACARAALQYATVRSKK